MLGARAIRGATDWLLQAGSQPVKYLTHKHILRTGARTKAFRAALLDARSCPEAREMLSKQRGDGSWCAGGSWAQAPSYQPKGGYSAFTPKYVTTVWILPFLADMGFTARDEPVRRACEYVLSAQRPNGLFSRFAFDQQTELARSGDDPPNNPCDLAIHLLALGSVGMGPAPKLRKSYDLLLRFQRADGGWVNQFHKDKFGWTRSCPWVSYHAAAALYHSGLAAHRKPLGAALEFLVWHMSLKDDETIRRPFYHGHMPVRELLMLSEMRVGLSERPVRVMLDYLLGMFDAGKGHFRCRPAGRRRRGDPTAKVLKYRLHHLMEDDWLTYYGVRILSNLR